MTLTATELAEKFGEATENLKNASVLEAEALERSIGAEKAHTLAKSSILASQEDPKALGANEAIREAKLREMLTSHADVVAETEAYLRATRLQTNLARITFDGLKAQLRIAEIVAGTAREQRS